MLDKSLKTSNSLERLGYLEKGNKWGMDLFITVQGNHGQYHVVAILCPVWRMEASWEFPVDTSVDYFMITEKPLDKNPQRTERLHLPFGFRNT